MSSFNLLRGDASEKEREAIQAAELVKEAVINEKFAHLVDYITVPSDKSVKPIIGNPEIEKLEDFEYVANLEDIELLNLNELANMEKEQLEQFLIKIYRVVVATNSTKDRLNLMNYFVTIIPITKISITSKTRMNLSSLTQVISKEVEK